MRRGRTQNQHAQRVPANSGSMSPISTSSITMAALLILTTPPCFSVPLHLQRVPTQRPLSQMEAACSSRLPADLQLRAPDVLQELCVLMLVQKSKTPQSQPLLTLASQLRPRKQRGLSIQAELQGPGGIQSRGFFLYRPRNGRRFLQNK